MEQKIRDTLARKLAEYQEIISWIDRNYQQGSSETIEWERLEVVVDSQIQILRFLLKD